MNTTRENRSLGFPTWSDTNQLTQSQKKARSLKFQMEQEVGLYYLCSKNSYCTLLCVFVLGPILVKFFCNFLHKAGFLMTLLFFLQIPGQLSLLSSVGST